LASRLVTPAPPRRPRPLTLGEEQDEIKFPLLRCGRADYWTVNVANLVTPPYFAMIFTTVLEATDLVFTVALAVVAPPGTVTLAETVAAAMLLLESATTTPAAGAGPLSVTVAVELVPSGTLVGLIAIETRAGALTESVAVRVTVPYFA